MDTRIRTTSPAAPTDIKMEQSPPLQDKISAYYSLVFPHYTFYIQTLSVTIGRRCAPNPQPATSSTAEFPTVDVDLGALKSVSRLHAKIEYDQDEDRFVLIVIGRNGAWVDGVWGGSGSRAPLSERSQIQIASRIFHFILPPPPPPEDTPSPSSQSSANRPRSPSVDITSISPPSSQPSNSPPPPAERKLPGPPPEPQLPSLSSPEKSLPAPSSHPQLPNSNHISKSNKSSNPKKRKKGSIGPPVLVKPKPEDMPPKPPFTYAQLIYRAIKAIGEKATLQEICSWIMNTHEYYRYTDSSWMSSVRHNLSSSRAFLKLERCGGDRGKGFFWKLDERYSQALEEQEARNWQTGLPAGEGSGKRKKNRALALLDPPLKRSVKGEPKGPLPPPLTSTPLPMKSAAATQPGSKDFLSEAPFTAATGVFAYSTCAHQTNAKNAQTRSTTASSHSSPFPLNGSNLYSTCSLYPTSTATTTGAPASSTLPRSAAAAPSAVEAEFTTNSPLTQPIQPPLPPVSQVSLPIVLGPIPPSHPDYSPFHPHNSAKEGYMILHERTLILDPDVFSGLSKETLENLEKMGTIAALQILKGHMVKTLKERRAKGKRKTGRRTKKCSGVDNPPPFTNIPLERRAMPVASAGAMVDGDGHTSETPADADAHPPDASAPTDCGSPIVVVDEDSGEEGPAAKRRKVDCVPS